MRKGYHIGCKDIAFPQFPNLCSHVNFEDISKQMPDDKDMDLVMKDRKAASLICLVTSDLNSNMTAFGKFSTIVHILAYMLHFIYNCQSSDERMTGPFLFSSCKMLN